MSKKICTFNENGICTELEEFPEQYLNPCRFRKEGLCEAEESDLVKICPSCGFEHKSHECDETDEETLWVPKAKKRVSPKETNV